MRRRASPPPVRTRSSGTTGTSATAAMARPASRRNTPTTIPGPIVVTLTVSDAFGRPASAAAATNAASGVTAVRVIANRQLHDIAGARRSRVRRCSSTPPRRRRRRDASIVSYQWDFGDGTPAGSGIQTSHAYSVVGSYTVTLTVIDDIGHKGVLSQPSVRSRPIRRRPPSLRSRADSRPFRGVRRVRFGRGNRTAYRRAIPGRLVTVRGLGVERCRIPTRGRQLTTSP